MELIGKSLLLLLITFFVLPSISYADNLDDNPLLPLMVGEKQKMRIEVKGMIPPISDLKSNRIKLQSENLPHKFTVKASSFPVKSYLYIFTSEYSPSSVWTLKFNGATIVKNQHSNSIGSNINGDGKSSIRQTFFFDVTDLVTKGENTLSIFDVSSTEPYYFDGAILLNFYKSDDEHQYWIYHGVEYIEHFEEFYKFDRKDAIYSRNFPFADYPVQSSATLYTVYHNKEEELDELKFNNQPLRDRDALYILDGSHLLAKKFDVSRFLDDNDEAVFTVKKFQAFTGADLRQYEGVPIYPSLVILEAKPSVNSKVVVLANSIDSELADESGLYDYIESMDFDVVQATPDDFEKYRNHRFIIILGGPDAPEGVGEEVRAADILDSDDSDYIRIKGNKHNFEARDVWSQLKNQFVWILAGSDREQTKQAHIDNRIAIVEKIQTLIEPSVTKVVKDSCSPFEDNPFNHTPQFSTPAQRGKVYICAVSYRGDPETWGIILHNQGDFDIDLNHYQLSDRRGRFYVIRSEMEDIIPSKGFWLIDGLTFNPAGRPYSTSLLYLHPKSGSLELWDDQNKILDLVVWELPTFVGDFADIPFYDKPDRDPFCLKTGSFYQGSVC